MLATRYDGLHREGLVRIFGGRAQILVRKKVWPQELDQSHGKMCNVTATQTDGTANSPGKPGQSSFGAADGNNKNIVNKIEITTFQDNLKRNLWQQ